MRADLAEKALTYTALGVTLGDDWPAAAPPGFRAYEGSVQLLDDSWAGASNAVLRWEVKTRSGFSVESDQPWGGDEVGRGQRFWLVAHLGPLRVVEPVEVIGLIDEPDRRGFAYGTLTGHPVSGEEAFLVTRRPDGSVWLTLRSMTRPSSNPWRFAFPAVLVAQQFYRRRYLRALAPARR